MPDDRQRSALEESAILQALTQLRNRAYTYLARREYSQLELRQKLEPHDQFEQIDQLLNELIQKNVQSDDRFAEQLGRTRVNAGKGPVLLKQELKQHRIDPEVIARVMEEYQGEWRRLAEHARVKKFGPELPADYKEWARQARFLQQRGFSARDIPEFRG